LTRLCRFQLRLRPRGLTANVIVIELQQELSFADVITLLHQKAFHGSCYGSVRFEAEVLDGLNFTVGRNHAADRPTLYCDGTNPHRSLM
jgi:hypothetical protein